MGNLSSLDTNTSLATPNADFNSTAMTLRLEDGQTSVTFAAPILEVRA